MLIEIPEPDVILSVILAFIIGLGGLYLYYKVRPFIKTSHNIDSSQAELLEYYERQLIDMKIRLDSMEMQGVEQKKEDPTLEIKQYLDKLSKNQQIIENSTISPKKTEVVKEETKTIQRMPNLDHNNAIDYVLHLITDKAMTSRDIQITLKRSREHTSRLLKKLFDDGFVNRNTSTKPYTYSITEKGREKINVLESNSLIA